MADQALLDRVCRRLEQEPRLDAAWLFGSRATGRQREDSDVDIAVLFGRAVPSFDATLVRGRLADDLRGSLPLEVDVVDIARIAPVTFAILFRDARLLLDRDPGHRLDACCRQLAMWHDMQPHYALQRDALRAFFA
jgi:predicted nucleotidyltransferase